MCSKQKKKHANLLTFGQNSLKFFIILFLLAVISIDITVQKIK